MRNLAILFGSACLAGLAACGPPLLTACGPARPDGPDVVVILIDTLRPDHLEAYGYEKSTAPFLAELAAKSVVFRRAFSTSSWTAPSTASLFTAMYPPRHGVTEGFRAQTGTGGSRPKPETPPDLELTGLPRSLPSLPELMREAGYRTFGLSANVNIGSELGFARGFDRFRKLDKRQGDAQQMARILLEWKPEVEASPYFLYLHFNDVHRPYKARAPWYQATDDETLDAISRYDSEIRFLDTELRGLYDAFGWSRDTALLVVSDHGEGLMQRGEMGHSFSLHHELTHALWILHAPGLEPREVMLNASLVDAIPTLLELAGLEPAGSRDGRSLAAFARGDATPEESAELAERPVFAHRSGARFRWNRGKSLWSVTQGSFKLIEDKGAQTLQLFDLEADPGELHDLAATRPDLADALTARLRDFQRQAQPLESVPVRVELDPALSDELRTLGYVED